MNKRIIFLFLLSLFLMGCVTFYGFPSKDIQEKTYELYKYDGVCLRRAVELQNYIVIEQPNIISRLVVGFYDGDRPHAWVEYRDNKDEWRLLEPTHPNTISGYKIKSYKPLFSKQYDYEGIVYYIGIVDEYIIRDEWSDWEFIHGYAYESVYGDVNIVLEEGEIFIINLEDNDNE